MISFWQLKITEILFGWSRNWKPIELII